MPLKPTDPTGFTEVDRVNALVVPTLADYVAATSQYVLLNKTIDEDAKKADEKRKAAQIRLSGALARVLVSELRNRLASVEGVAGERRVAGALRTVNADVHQYHPLDGLRLAVEIKPVNLAVGRAIWNRFGDIRAFAVNIHLKFPFAVVGGVMAFPTWELAEATKTLPERRKDTRDLIRRAVARFMRVGDRKTEGDAPHLLEGIGIIVYDPDSATIEPAVPPPGSGLRWDEFVERLAFAYEARFED
jgi:hypothetical protein